MRRLVLFLGICLGVLVAASFLVYIGRDVDDEPPVSAPAGADWGGLDPQARCDRAVELIAFRERWPTVCRWRQPGEVIQAQAFPPPPGPPPYDAPRVEVYVAPEQSREELARAIAHEFGHMHHTREPAFFREWLAARNLDPGTPPEVWTEDYAEVFAALFGPPAEGWRAPTARPDPDALADLEARFFF